MDPNTVVILLAANLICSGGLFYLIGMRMPAHSGALHWSAGYIVFGVAYIALLSGSRDMGLLGNVVVDTAMVVGALLFLAGTRHWVGKPLTHRRWLLWLAAAYAAAQFLSVWLAAAPGRFFLLNMTLAVVYGLIALTAAVAKRQQDATLRLPLLLLMLLTGVLSLLTSLRGTIILSHGTSALYSGLAAQVYYAYASLAVVLLGLNLLWMVFVRLNSQLHELASRDALTRVLNRNGLDDVLARHFAARDAAPVTLLEVDVDHFKRINDEFGHAAGDRVLRALADTLTRHVRGNDFVARTGGEEFLIGCVGGDVDVALGLGERLRAGAAALQVPGREGAGPLNCTVSIGVSGSFAALGERDRAMREADEALYAAKAGGRNRVVHHASEGIRSAAPA